MKESAIMDRPGGFLLAIVFIFGFTCSRATLETSPDLDERKAVIDCMADVGYEAADPNASRLEQLHQSQRWCEQFMQQRPARVRAAARI